MLKKVVILALATTLIFVFLGYFWWQNSLKPVSDSKQERVFTISRGESLDSISARLEQDGFVHSSIVFKLYAYQTDLKSKIQAGSFRLSQSMDLPTIALSLTHGSQDIWITFPEGLRREEIIAKLAQNFVGFDSANFLMITSKDEGKLFPDTYSIPKESDSKTVRQIFLTNYDKKYSDELKQQAKLANLSENQVLTLASIIEREARKDKDRKNVAGILLKRLKADWPLQVDATVQYAVANQRCKGNITCDWWQPVIHSDLEIISVYNSYLNKGLPPAPICNPSLSSIKAVLYPEETEFWFYLNDLSGEMHYAVTGEEHNQNVEDYLR